MSAEDLFQWPPNSLCFAECVFGGGRFASGTQNKCFNACSVTDNLVNFLNLTAEGSSYFQAYCLNPPPDDSCALGYCPNSDIAGVLVRVSSYITSFCLSLLIFYHPKSAEASFWSQILTVYSLLITCAIAIFQTSLTRFHAAIATVTAGSPLNLYLFIYSIASFFVKKHRLRDIVGRGHIFARCVMIVAGILWIALLVYVFAPAHLTHYAQRSCESKYILVSKLYIVPLILFQTAFKTLPWFAFVITFPIAATVFGWIVAIILQRKAIWPPEERWSPQFRRVWSITLNNYSFIHFMTIAVIPTLYWVCVVELGCAYSADVTFSLSFGQVLAAFVAVPPILSVLQLYPMVIEWFLSLFWVRYIIKVWDRTKPQRLQHPRVPVVAEGYEEGIWEGSDVMDIGAVPYPPALIKHQEIHYSKVSRDDNEKS